MIKDNKARYIKFAGQISLPLFFQPWWLDMVSNKWDAVWVENNGKIQAVWVFTIERKLGLTLIRNPLLTPYLGPLFFLPENLSEKKKEQQEEKLLSQLLALLPEWDFLQAQCLPGLNPFLIFHQNAISHTQRVTYYIDLREDENRLWEQVAGKQRYAIRQAERELTLADVGKEYEMFYSFHKDTLESKGEKYPYTKAFFKKIFIATQKQSASYARMAVNAQGETTAMVFSVYDAEKMYLLLTAKNKQTSHNGAVALLIWDAIKKAKELGLKIFDFEGSMDKGIEQFFRSFGGERNMYLQVTANRSRLWKLKEWIR